mmetsp:Transcript_23237/g.47049  ORF Transcript_23237/g.47049 Transcript_23237/m.47049 type:complete len:428 (+) Transcript_23237:84-1367(+)
MGNCIQKPNQSNVGVAAADGSEQKDGGDNKGTPLTALDTSEESTAISSPATSSLASTAAALSFAAPSAESAATFVKRKQNYTFQDVQIVETITPSSIEGDSFQIPLKIYRPKPKQQDYTPRAVVFFIHGGIFAQGDRHSHPSIATALASHSEINLIVVTASFRNGKVATWKSGVCLRDLVDVCDFCRREFCDKLSSENGGSLPFGLVGSSSGGFFALTLCRLQSQLQSQAQLDQTNENSEKKTQPPSFPIPIQTLPVKIQFCIAITPVANPHHRASYLRSSISGSARSDQFVTSYQQPHDPERSQFILEKQLSFWEDDETMILAGESLMRKRNLGDTNDGNENGIDEDVPTLLILGSQDKNVPFGVTKDVQSWATKTVVIGGKGHELCDDISDIIGGYQCYLPDVERFLDFCLNRDGVESTQVAKVK